MDDKLLEFWSEFFLNAFKNKKKIGDLFSWMQQDMNAFSFPGGKSGDVSQDMASLFRKMYGIDRMSVQGEEYEKLASKAAGDFRRSLKEFMNSLGLVPLQEHLKLIRKYEKLKEDLKDREETIKHLKMLANETKKEDDKFSGSDFQEIVKEQGDFFLNILKEFSSFKSEPMENQDPDVLRKPKENQNDKTSSTEKQEEEPE